jgi:Tfp pilus assembly protein PilF
LSNYTRAYLLLAGAKGMIASRGGLLSKVINGTAVLPNLKKAETLQPDSQVVMFGLGSFYFLAPAIAGGNINKARDYLEKAIKVDPLFADAYVRLAQVYKVRGDNEKYEKYLRTAWEIDPENALLKDFERGQCRFNCVTVEE